METSEEQNKSLVFDEEPATEPGGDTGGKTLSFDDEGQETEPQNKQLVFDDQQRQDALPEPGPADASVSEAGEPDSSIGRFIHGMLGAGKGEEKMGRAGQFTSQLFQGAGDFVSQLPKTAAWLTENTALGGPPTPPDPEEVKDQSFSEWLFGGEEDVERLQENEMWQFGRQMKREIDEVFPENPEYRDEFLTTMLPRAAGDFAALGGAAALTGGSSLASGAALGASTAAPRAFEAAKAEGASDDEALAQFYANLGIGGLEGLPLARSFSRIDRATGGALKKAIGETASNTVRGVAEEAAQEAISTTLNNTSAKVLYDETRNILENVPESAALGGLLGGSLNAVGTAVNAKLAQADNKQEVAEAKETRDLLRDEIEEARKRGAIDEAEAERMKQQYTDPDIRNQDVEPADVDEVDPDSKTLDASFDTDTDTWTQKAWKWVRGMGEEKAFYPQSAKEIETRYEGRLDKEFAKVKRNIDEVNRAVKREMAGLTGEEADADFFGSDAEASVADGVYKDITDVMRGDKDYTVLPEGVRQPVKNMRNHVDRLSNELINKGIAEGPVVAKIERNLGSYLTRAYRKDSDAVDWELEDIPESTKKNAMHHIKKQFRQERGREPSRDEVQVVMEELLDMRDLDQDFASAVGKGSLDWGPLKKREDFPEPIRALWGEYTDGTLAYAKTIEKVSNLVHGHEYYNKLRTRGLKEGWLVDPENADASDIKGKKRLAPEGSKAKEPIAGLMADEEVADAIMDTSEEFDRPGWMEAYVRINGGMKFAATVGNQITHIRNFAGGAMMQMNQGVNPFNRERASRTYEMLKKDLGLRGPVEAARGDKFEVGDEVESRLDRARELGLMDQSVRAGDLMAVFADAETGGRKRSFVDRVGRHKDKGRSSLWGAHRMARMGAEKVSKLYQAEDNFHRLMLWMAEADRYSQAMHGKKYSDLEGQEKRRIEELAGNVTRRTYQNYEQVPEGVKKLRRFPVLGTFVSFPYEVLRTSANTWRQAKREMNHSNKDVRRIGYKRRASQLAMSTGIATSAVTGAMNAMQGVGLTEQEDKDLRQFLAPWDQKGSLAMVGKDGMKYEYFNVGYLDPYNMFGEPIRAWAQSENPMSTEGVKNFAEGLARQFQPFYSQDLLTQKVSQVIANENQWGGPVYYEGDTWGRFAADVGMHFLKGLTPQVIRSGVEVADAYGAGFVEDPQDAKDPDNAWMAALGMRVTEVDTEKSFEIQASNFADRMRDLRAPFNEVKYDESASFSDKLQAMKQQNSQYASEAKDFMKKIDSIYRLGLTQEQIKQKMVDAGIPKRETESLISGLSERMLTMEDITEEQN